MNRVALVAIGIAACGGGVARAAPCEAPEHRQFDFWLGQWEVRGPAANRPASSSRITSEYGGCVVHERYTAPGGYAGESLNGWDPVRRVWHQTWMDNSGLVLLLDGGLVGKSMVLQGEGAAQGGRTARHRITWTPNEDGSVRQHWETTDPSGQWTTTFDGRYTRPAQ